MGQSQVKTHQNKGNARPKEQHKGRSREGEVVPVKWRVLAGRGEPCPEGEYFEATVQDVKRFLLPHVGLVDSRATEMEMISWYRLAVALVVSSLSGPS